MRPAATGAASRRAARAGSRRDRTGERAPRCTFSVHVALLARRPGPGRLGAFAFLAGPGGSPRLGRCHRLAARGLLSSQALRVLALQVVPVYQPASIRVAPPAQLATEHEVERGSVAQMQPRGGIREWN